MSQSNTTSIQVSDSTSSPSQRPLWIQVLAHKPMPLLLGISVLWIIGSIGLYLTSCCFAPASNQSLSIRDGAISVASASSSVVFSKKEVIPEISEEVNRALATAVDYIKMNPNKLLIIKGQESATAEVNGLAMQRATNMKAELVKLGAPFKRMITKVEAVSSMEVIRNKVFGGVDFEIKTISGHALLIQSKDGFSAKAKTNLSFNQHSANIIHPYPTAVKSAARQVIDYLKNNPSQGLIIKGWSGVSERDEYLEGLGNQRANNLKNWWIGMGAPIFQVIVVENQVKQPLFFVDNQLFGGADYWIAPLKDYVSTTEPTTKIKVTDADLAKVSKSVTIYFDYDSDIPKIDTTDATTLKVYINYLKSNLTAKVILSGYTDDLGSPSYNLKLSGKRAASIQTYLEKRAVNSAQVKIQKMGILKPKTSKDIKKAREKSRKVELSIIK